MEIFSIKLANQELLYDYQPQVMYIYQAACNIYAVHTYLQHDMATHTQLVIGVKASA